jgi:hypothetical protein
MNPSNDVDLAGNADPTLVMTDSDLKISPTRSAMPGSGLNICAVVLAVSVFLISFFETASSMSQNARALIVRELGEPFTFEDIIVDDIRSDEALVKIEASGICRTDLHCAAGHRPVQVPAVFGHEGSFTSVSYEIASNISRGWNRAPSWRTCNRNSARRQSVTQLLHLSRVQTMLFRASSLLRKDPGAQLQWQTSRWLHSLVSPGWTSSIQQFLRPELVL